MQNTKIRSSNCESKYKYKYNYKYKRQRSEGLTVNGDLPKLSGKPLTRKKKHHVEILIFKRKTILKYAHFIVWIYIIIVINVGI